MRSSTLFFSFKPPLIILGLLHQYLESSCQHVQLYEQSPRYTLDQKNQFENDNYHLHEVGTFAT